MNELRTKLLRQTEIVGMVIGSKSKFTITDLAEAYNCEELTIKRDLQELRSFGIDIHSGRKLGIFADSEILVEKIKELFRLYSQTALPASEADKATNLLFDMTGIYSITILTSLKKAIEANCKVIFNYNRPTYNVKSYLVEPVLIFHRDTNWRLLAYDDKKLKQFILERISDVEITKHKYEKHSSDQISQLFRTSLKGWIGEEKISAKLKVTGLWMKIFSRQKITEEQRIIEQNDDFLVVELIVNSIHELASWVVSKGKGIEVLDPPELKSYVIEIAKNTISNYQ